MITYDQAWHDRRAFAADVVLKDHDLATRLSFYINRFMEKPDCLGAPRANARGILVNALGYTEEEANHHIENEVIIRQNRI